MIYNKAKIEQLAQEYKGTTCKFGEMESAFAKVTGDEVLNNIDERELLESGSTSFQADTDENMKYWINVEYDVLNLDEDNLLKSEIKITDIDWL